ncbi:MAG TPA: hypothetical protein VFE53_22945 [Mucilaginibacter sp.]|jgi:hypothetical protein|nr:hypothetical protein [Mucilaginibacter sp.]
MNRKKKSIIYASLAIIAALILFCFFPASQNLDPEEWVKITISDTINAPLTDTWTLAGDLDFKGVAGDRKYDNLPEITRTKPFVGNFSKAGDSRIVYFSTGDTLVESIRVIQGPHKFEYELTKPSLPLKWFVYKARGAFEYAALNNDKTMVKWTYSFLQRNLVSRFFIQKYIDNTHKAWMTDMLKATKTQTEKAYVSSLVKK